MIKVKDTKEHKVVKLLPYNNHGHNVVVTDAELVLVECKSYDSRLCSYHSGHLELTHKHGLVISDTKWFNPIFISRTEKIEKGDWHWNRATMVNNAVNDPNQIHKYRKVLALPEHFSPEQLQDIVDGKLKEGKYLLECDPLFESLFNGVNPPAFIKLNPYIIIHPFEEKMYTRKELREVIGQYQDFTESNSLLTTDQWFELNVK